MFVKAIINSHSNHNWRIFLQDYTFCATGGRSFAPLYRKILHIINNFCGNTQNNNM